MKITVLDRDSLGSDTPLDGLGAFGVVEYYSSTAYNEIVDRAYDSEILILNKVKITGEVIRALPKLRLICVFATGYDNIDILAAKECGVAVCNVPGYSSESVALCTVSTTLALVTHLFTYRSFVTGGEYQAAGVPNRLVPVYHELTGMTWGVIGYGGIGRAVSRIAKALGARVIVNKRTPVDDVECVDLDTLCRESDIITVHCPLNDESRGMINAERIGLMKKSVILVNEARGAVLNEQEVAEAVLTDRISGFGCDVYSSEPFPKGHPYEKIMHKDNVILTPHFAWGAYEARVRCINIIAENIKAFVDGEIKNRVDI